MGKNAIKSTDSPSLWNCTLSSGWTREEVAILRLAVMKFGLGRWKEIIESGCLPGKNPSQLSLQCQRMIGQQSLGEFMSIRLDTDAVYRMNDKKKGVIRKNGFIINTGDTLTAEDRHRKVKENIKTFELPKEESDAIVLEDRSSELDVIKSQKKERLDALYKRLEQLQNERKERTGEIFHLANVPLYSNISLIEINNNDDNIITNNDDNDGDKEDNEGDDEEDEEDEEEEEEEAPPKKKFTFDDPRLFPDDILLDD